MHQKRPFHARKGDDGFNRGSAGARKGDGGFSRGSADTRKGDGGFRRPAQLAYTARLRCPWPAAGPGRASSRRTSTRQRTRRRGCGVRRRELPRCRWAVAGPGQATHRHPDRLEAAARPAGPGQASRRRTEPHISDPAPLVWRAPEGPEGTGGLRGAAPSEARSPSLAGGRTLRRREHPWGNKQPGPAGKARRSSPSEPCARAGASRLGQNGCGPRCAAPRLRCR